MQIDKIIISLITNNPTKWLRFYVILSVIILFAILFNSLLRDSLTFLADNFTYLVFNTFLSASFIPVLVGLTTYIIIRTPLKKTVPSEKLKKIAGFFLLLWIIGAIQYPIMWLGAGFNHIDCNQNCISDIVANDWVVRIFPFIWIIPPFYFWLKTRQAIKQTPTANKQA